MIIGLTGGIGSGKTQACKFFKQLGVHVEDADEVSRALTQKGTDNYKLMCEKFSHCCENGQLNRQALRNEIANNTQSKFWLEQLIHPQVIQTLQDNLEKALGVYSILASPLLLEIEDLKNIADRILLIDVNPQIQLARASKRDKVSQEQIKGIINLQMSRENKLKLADDVIDNSNDIKALKALVQSMHEHYLGMQKKY